MGGVSYGKEGSLKPLEMPGGDDEGGIKVKINESQKKGENQHET